MKINVLGRGKVPGINALAPVYNREADIAMIKRILAFRVFRVFSSETGLQITTQNVNEYIEKDYEPNQHVEKVVIKPISKEEVPVEPKPFIPPVVDEKTPEVEEVIEEVVESEPEEIIDDVIETTVEDIVEAPVVTEEATTDDINVDTTPVEVEAKTDNNYRSKRNKKKRYNDNK